MGWEWDEESEDRYGWIYILDGDGNVIFVVGRAYALPLVRYGKIGWSVYVVGHKALSCQHHSTQT